MLKIQKVMNNKDITVANLAINTGDRGKVTSLKRVFDREMEITSLSQSLLYSLARGMGLTLNDILEDFDLDGTTGQITTIKRTVERARRRLVDVTEDEIKKNHMILQSDNNQVRYDGDSLALNLDFDTNEKLKKFYDGKPFALGINMDKNDTIKGLFPFNMEEDDKEYTFINPKLPHSEQELPDITKLNAEYLAESQKRGKWNKDKQPLCINSIASRRINECPAIFIYTRKDLGGDFKVALTVFDKTGNTEFTEIYGVEWLDEDTNKSIVYYKSQYFEPFDVDNIKNSEKKIISELEFFRGMHSQFRKFKISK